MNQGKEVKVAQKPRFALGTLAATPGALAALQESCQTPLEFLRRHVCGDWGELCEEDRQENEFSLQNGFRVMSAYRTRKDVKLWVITEADRSVTTLLLPDEY